MSDQTSPTPKGATFTFVLGAFAAFAVLFSLIKWAKSGTAADPRAAERAAFAAEVHQSQDDLLAKMGVSDKAKAAALFAKTAETLKAKPNAASKMAVPAAVPAAAPAPAPAAAPAAPPAAPPAPAK